jgi:hypothetical protein
VADASSAAQINPIVAILSRRGVSQENRLVPSQDRAPVAPALAAMALSMHCMHMARL